jgi:peroxiredoxin
VFRSPIVALHELATGDHRVPFDVVADPGRVAYRLYGVGGRLASLWSMVSGRALGRVREARRAGLKPDWRDALRDGISGNPADFLIGPDGRIVRARYGRHFADSLLPKEALEWLGTANG